MVYLVGAGPGDPGLLTLRGAEVLRQADVVVYDRLVAVEILALAAPEARQVYVGKRPGKRAAEQEAINALLVSEAQSGGCVVRLKGGDPFVFGRGGEEALALRQAGVPFEIVPGITAGVAGPACAGIPVTHRGLSSAVVLVTGHEDPAKGGSDLDYDALARIGTVVFYMGVGRLSELAVGLLAAGRAAETPAAVIERATTGRQRTVLATLATVADRAASDGVEPPAIVVVGDVAGLRPDLAWFEARPLFGRTIVVTRTREQAAELAAPLRGFGARVLELPTLAVEPMGDADLASAQERLGEFEWLVLTSPNGVDRFFGCLDEHGRDARYLAGVKVAAMGPGTARRLAAHGVRADLVPSEAMAESLADALIGAGVGQGTAVLLARACDARGVLPETLRGAGARVDDVAVYRTVQPQAVCEPVLEAIAAGRVDLVTFTSGSTARHFAALVEAHGGAERLAAIRRDVAVAAIGPVTAEVARELGFTVSVVSPEHTIAGLVESVRRWAEETRDG